MRLLELSLLDKRRFILYIKLYILLLIFKEYVILRGRILYEILLVLKPPFPGGCFFIPVYGFFKNTMFSF